VPRYEATPGTGLEGARSCLPGRILLYSNAWCQHEDWGERGKRGHAAYMTGIRARRQRALILTLKIL